MFDFYARFKLVQKACVRERGTSDKELHLLWVRLCECTTIVLTGWLVENVSQSDSSILFQNAMTHFYKKHGQYDR